MNCSAQGKCLYNVPGVRFDMDVNVFFPLQKREGAVLIPEAAIFSTGEKNIVFLARPDGVIEPREVATGTLGEEGREVLSGLAEGDQVVVSGNFLIDSESRLKGALESMSAGGHQHGG